MIRQDPRPADKVECRHPRDAPRAWRSSYVRRDVPILPDNVVWGMVDAGILLARHIVPARTISVVRRLTAYPFRLGTMGIDFDPTPDWWHQPLQQGGTLSPLTLEGREPRPFAQWEWAWNVGHFGIDRRTRALWPGAVVQAPFNRIKDVLSWLTWDYNDDWQRLSDGGLLAMHGTSTRYIVEGPQVVQLWAICTLDGWMPSLPPPPSGAGHGAHVLGGEPEPEDPPIPFASSFGAMEGIDVPVDRWHNDPAQWLIP